jgi:hypothetical protein
LRERQREGDSERNALLINRGTERHMEIRIVKYKELI